QTPEPPELRINLPSGSVRIETVETQETRVELSGSNEDDARIEMRRNQIVIELERKKLFGVRGDYRLVVTAPDGTQVDAQTASGDVQVGIRQGSSVYIDASSMSGDMTSELPVSDTPPAYGPSVDFRARTMSGDVTVRRA